MSSQAARTAIIDAITPLADPLLVYNLSDYVSLEEVLTNITGQAVLIQFVVAEDNIQTIGGEGNQGYEETGTAVIHLIVPTGFDSSPVVAKGDSIRLGLRGRRLSDAVTVESMAPFVDFSSIGVDGAVHGYSSSLFYNRRDCG
jgi:hypothetical protein